MATIESLDTGSQKTDTDEAEIAKTQVENVEHSPPVEMDSATGKEAAP